jgi:hypothetical protein|tara:strand:- start:11686 stop:12051 length:366 start_codon:yes stop_codon:yes gene_type:complete
MSCAKYDCGINNMENQMQISVGNMKKRSIFKLTFFSALVMFAPFWAIVSALGVAGYDAVQFNETNVYGLAAVLVSTAICLIFSMFIAIFVTIGAWILAKLAPNSAAIVAKQEKVKSNQILE